MRLGGALRKSAYLLARWIPYACLAVAVAWFTAADTLMVALANSWPEAALVLGSERLQAALIVLAGTAGVEKAAKAAGHTWR